MALTPAELIEKYIRLRNKVADIKLKHIEELAPYSTVMQRIENELLQHLETTKLDSLKGSAGTAYKQVATSVTVDNWQGTLEFIKKREAWDLLEARVAKAAALAMVEDTEQPIPGVKISQTLVLRVRSS